MLGLRLRSVAVVVMDDATESVATAHWTMALTTRFRDRNPLLEAVMWACRVEDSDVIAHDASHNTLSQR
jgi:hypothetical protein